MQTENMVFVFGSNEAGVHGAGAALYAHENKGAILGVGFGPMPLTSTRLPLSFAIPTKNWMLRTLPLEAIKFYVERFIVYAQLNRGLEFQITRIGCGLAGLKDEEIAPLFETCPDNCYFDDKWKPLFHRKQNYWGMF